VIVRATVGMPVDNSGDGIETDRRFETLAVDFAPALSHWDTSVYVTQQRNDGLRDRQAVGTTGAICAPQLVSGQLCRLRHRIPVLECFGAAGTLQLPDRWQLTMDLEHRNAPLITTENALIGQPFTTLSELRKIYSEQQIADLARDRTPVLSTYSISALKQLGERFQAIMDVFYTKLTDTPPSGGVEEFTGTQGNDISYQVQLLGSSLLRTNDFNQVIVRYEHDTDLQCARLAVHLPFSVFGAWRAGPRILFQRKVTDTGYTSIFYAPYGHIDYQRHGHVLEIEGGAELGKNPAGLEIGNTTRLFVSIGYRINF